MLKLVLILGYVVVVVAIILARPKPRQMIITIRRNSFVLEAQAQTERDGARIQKRIEA